MLRFLKAALTEFHSNIRLLLQPQGFMQDEALDHKLGEAKGSLAAAYAALNRNYEQHKGTVETRSNTLSDMARTYADSASQGSDKQKLLPSSNSSNPGKGTYGGNGMGKFLETEDLEKLNMLAAAQKVAAYHVQQSSLLTVVRRCTTVVSLSVPVSVIVSWEAHTHTHTHCDWWSIGCGSVRWGVCPLKVYSSRTECVLASRYIFSICSRLCVT
jgi:hypothetical protein